MIADRLASSSSPALVDPQAGTISAIWVTDGGFNSLRHDWESLAVRWPAGDFSQWEWVIALAEVAGPQHRIEALVIRRDANVIGIIPFVCPRTRHFLKLHRIRPLGYHGNLEASCLTEEPIAVLDPRYRDDALRVVRRELDLRLQRGDADLWIASYLFPGNGERRRWRQGTHWTKTKPGPNRVVLGANWDAFRRRLSKSMRDNLSYYPRLLIREGHDFRVEWSQGPEEIPEAVDRLVRLHRLRSNSPRGPQHHDYFPTTREADLLKMGLSNLACEVRGFIATLYVDDEPVASQGFITSASRLTAHYSGFDPTFARYSPLLILQAEVFQRAMQQGVQEVDLLLGDAAWQRRWQPSRDKGLVQEYGLRPHAAAITRAGFYFLHRESARLARRIRTHFGRVATNVSKPLSVALPFLHATMQRLALSPMPLHIVAHGHRMVR